MEKTTLEELTATNETLGAEITDLRETVACLDGENQELLKETKYLKDKNKTLQETANGFQITMNEMQKNVEDIQEQIDFANMKIHHLDLQNKSLVKVNEELGTELQEVSYQMSRFQDYKAAQEKDLNEMQHLALEVKRHLNSLEDKLEVTEQRCALQKSHSAQLRDRVGELLVTRENQRRDIQELQGQVAMRWQQAMMVRLDKENNAQVGSLMHEIVETRLVNVTLNRSRRRKSMHYLWTLGKLLTILVFGCGLLLGLVFLYTYFINQHFISEMILILFSDQHIENIVQVLSQYLTWRNNGLLPF